MRHFGMVGCPTLGRGLVCFKEQMRCGMAGKPRSIFEEVSDVQKPVAAPGAIDAVV